MGKTIWQRCVDQLQGELSSQQFSTYIRPLQARGTNGCLKLLAPNRYVRDQVQLSYLVRINELLDQTGELEQPAAVEVAVGGDAAVEARAPLRADGTGNKGNGAKKKKNGFLRFEHTRGSQQSLNESFTFDTFVEGKSNELAKAAALQVANLVGEPYNPLLLYGGVGLGKTHLMQAIGNRIRQTSQGAKLVYVHAQGFVQDMVDALRQGTVREFSAFYRSAEFLLIDDIQFFAKKARSQEEFFHLFNGLKDLGHQMVFTSDQYPREIDGLEERLKSRCSWGLTVAVGPPELETRVAILLDKAEAEGMPLDPDVAFFIAKHVRSNVRELEGALRRVIAKASFFRRRVDMDLVKSSIGDVIASEDRRIRIDKIQRTVAEYYNIRVSDILSKRRNRNIARPRQMAMFLAKELTAHSLPEIGEAFGGRDHTTVLHAHRKIRELIDQDVGGLGEDRRNLSRLLSA